jgi:hypothetical protein
MENFKLYQKLLILPFLVSLFALNLVPDPPDWLWSVVGGFSCLVAAAHLAQNRPSQWTK